MTKIEWAHRTWNPVRARLLSTGAYGYHCEKVSAGCAGCYAETWNMRGLENQGTRLPYKPGHRDQLQHVIDAKALMAPFAWRKPQRIFVGSMTDIFGDWVTDAMLDQILAVIALNPHHIFMLLTKRPARAKAYFSDKSLARADGRGAAMIKLWDRLDTPNHDRIMDGCRWPLPNLALGTSVEDQPSANDRLVDLLATPARWRFLSCEPMLGAINLRRIKVAAEHHTIIDALQGYARDFTLGRGPEVARIHLVIAGGMSGRRAAPLHPDIVRSLRDQCAAAGTPFFFKQWGHWQPVEIGADGSLNPPVPIDRNIMRWRRWGDGVWREAAKGEKVDTWFQPGTLAVPLGKKAAGRTLDGAIHSALPAGWPA